MDISDMGAASRAARRLKRAANDSGTEIPLSVAQAWTAQVLGVRDWQELIRVLPPGTRARPALPEAAAELEPERSERRHFPVEREVLRYPFPVLPLGVQVVPLDTPTHEWVGFFPSGKLKRVWLRATPRF